MGPMASGKSTVAGEIAKLIQVPRVPMDRLRWYYYFSEGYSLEQDEACGSFTERMHYWKPFELSAVKRILAEFPNSVIDFGAGHSYYPDAAQFEIAKKLLSALPNVFLILPSEDKEESIRICNERLKVRDGGDAKPDEVNRWFIEHPSNSLLSKHVIYNKDESPAKTARRIVDLLK